MKMHAEMQIHRSRHRRYLQVSVQLHTPTATRQGNSPSTYLIGGQMGARVGLDSVEYRNITCASQESNPGHPANSPSLYRLS
jgi:hypothetical protein